VLLLPAACTTAMPEAIRLSTDASRAGVTHGSSQPRLMLTTAGRTALALIHSSPAMIPSVEPSVAQSRMRTAWTVASRATPYLDPTAVPATCVPWPLQSPGVASLSTMSTPAPTRPVNSWCEALIPESTT
jgi:hypothetical protein